jgi:hypothetical protein
VGILVIHSKLASCLLSIVVKMHATFFQKVILCAIAGFLAASVLQWAKVFVEGADDALNKGYKHRAVIDLTH